PGKIVLLVVTTLFALCGIYAAGYLRVRRERDNRAFCAWLLVFLGTVTAVAWIHHLGLLWVTVEATTLTSAPLMLFNRTPGSLEATWKYLMICSVGIAMALLGTYFLAYAALGVGGVPSLDLDDLARAAPRLSGPWLRSGFILLVVGYGTKMGLAPMHTWKPDAYGEAPGLVGALLAGGLTNCAFLAILRVYRIAHAAADGQYAGALLLILGILSMGAAAAFVIRQADLKRMLAYSSVEHMGVLAVGIGIGAPGAFGALWHVLNNGLAKGALFLSVGTLHRAFGAKTIDKVRGGLRVAPAPAALTLVGFLAIAGTPPFGPFFSELSILTGALEARRYVTAALVLLFFLLTFVGMGSTVLRALQGPTAEPGMQAAPQGGVLTALPVVVLLGLVLLLGVYLPEPVRRLLQEAADYVGHAP
ncbi:MAG TPA: proton-conducting transporter membrane subunit, partial [bacterium]|nr:proton-conducting transporter membrane subunit [bacterium]